MAETGETARALVRRIVAERPSLNQTEIARLVGVSRERVRQIVQQEGLSVVRGARGVRGRTPQPRVLTGGVPVTINATVAGTIAELLAAADLSARGYVVFFPLVRTAACDLVVLARDGTTERIEVRCGHRNGSGQVCWASKDRSQSDRRAIVLTGEPVRYSPPYPGDKA